MVNKNNKKNKTTKKNEKDTKEPKDKYKHIDINEAKNWSDDHWCSFLLTKLIDPEIVTWQEVTELVLGAISPPAVSSRIAGNKHIQAKLESGKAVKTALGWLYNQPPGCMECKTLLKLEIDHIKSLDESGDDAHHIDNIQILCKRCNCKKRPNYSSNTYLSNNAGLMWLYFHYEPDTYEEFSFLCKAYGFNKRSSSKFREAWVISIWLKKYKPSKKKRLYL